MSDEDNGIAAQAADEVGAFIRDPDDRFSEASGMLFEQAMAQTRMAVCISDPRQPGCPIIFANRAFRTLTGYDQDEIVGRNCRFLQGPGTDPAAVTRLSQALKAEEVVIVEMLNYRKDGTSFWNALHIGPIYDSEGRLLYFFGSQWDVTDVHSARADEQHARMVSRELSHRMKNMFSVVSAIVNIVGRSQQAEEVSRSINERIHALGRAYETTLDVVSGTDIFLAPAIENILSSYRGDKSRMSVDGEDFAVPFSLLSAIGLMLHELAANATKYGAFSVSTGRVDVSWRREWIDAGQPVLAFEWRETDGPPITEAPTRLGTGTMLLDRIIRTFGGTIERDWAPGGLIARLRVPLA